MPTTANPALQFEIGKLKISNTDLEYVDQEGINTNPKDTYWRHIVIIDSGKIWEKVTE